MRPKKFKAMSAEEFANHHVQSEAEQIDYEREAAFRQWCGENELDPADEESYEQYEEMLREISGEDMSPEDRAGWDDNIGKSFDN